MKRWVVVNQKGGVGKTTTAVSLSGILAEQGNRVLMVDIDPHASMTHYFGVNPESLESSVYDAFAENPINYDRLRSALLPMELEGLDLLPSTIALATLDKKFGHTKGLGLCLKRALDYFETDYDYVLIDCPPVLGVLMINALATAHQIIIPVQTEFLAIKGLERMLATIDMVYRKPKVKPPVAIVPTMYDKRTRANVDSLRYLRQTFEELLWRSVIAIDTHFRDASQAHQVASKFSPESRGVTEYKQLCKDLQKGTINRFVSIMEAV